ncbi:50S ribosomal protein L29 [Candidatus Woesearchaeota archaeon]|nr:50S ribosomal protein L29 [Candidatus Woesearchaeota archaeon]
MKAKEIRQLSVEELGKKEVEIKKELMKLNAQVAMGGALKSPGQIKQYKKTIAKINTIRKEKEEKK